MSESSRKYPPDKNDLLLLWMHIHRKKASQYFKSLKYYLKALYSNVKAL